MHHAIFYIRIQRSRAQIRFTGIANCETESVCSNNDNKFYCNCAIPFWCRKKLSKCEKVHCSLIWIAKICYYCLTLLALFDTHFSWAFFVFIQSFSFTFFFSCFVYERAPFHSNRSNQSTHHHNKYSYLKSHKSIASIRLIKKPLSFQ